MISGSILGHMAIWNLEDKRLIAQIREAHMSSVNGMHTLDLEPLMITSSSDNSVKVVENRRFLSFRIIITTLF